jgi:hypothetical protein
MGSQNKVVNDKEFRSWAEKTKPKTFVAQGCDYFFGANLAAPVKQI